MSEQLGARDARTRFLALQTRLQRSEGADEQLLKEAAAALDEAVQSGVALAAREVEPLLLRPPWSDSRPEAAAARGGGGLNIEEARRVLCMRRPRASALLDFLDARTEVHEPHRRLGEQRHRPWAAASVRACVAAVRQAAEHTGGRAPLVLVAEGSLGAEAAAAAAAGGRVVVCEPNRFAAAAVRAVAARHGVTVLVRPLTLEALCTARAEEARADVLVLTPLLEEAALGCRILPSAAAAAAAAGDEGSDTLPLCVPRAVRISGALARLRTAEVLHRPP